MFFSAVRVTPDPKYSAEVVVLLTTLGAKRTEFNAGKRVRDLLEIKRVHHKIVDFNKDARGAGTGEAENQAIQKLMQQGKLQAGDNDDLILPQIFIDGQYLGDANELQGLEDDGMLDSILLRRACMKCNDQRRQPDSSQCMSCWEKFEEVLPGLMTIEQTLQELALTADDDYGEEYDDEYDEEGTEDAAVSLAAGGKAPPAPQPPRAPVAAGTATPAPPPAPVPPCAPPAPGGAHGVPGHAAARARGTAAAGAPAGAGAPAPPLPLAVGEKVQYWSDTKKRYVDAVIEGKREKEGVTVYDLNCKKGASLDKIRRPQ